jgi:hypothetical protein
VRVGEGDQLRTNRLKPGPLARTSMPTLSLAP